MLKWSAVLDALDDYEQRKGIFRKMFFSRAKLIEAVLTILKKSVFYSRVGSPSLSQLLQMARDSTVSSAECTTDTETFKILMTVLSANASEKTKLSHKILSKLLTSELQAGDKAGSEESYHSTLLLLHSIDAMTFDIFREITQLYTNTSKAQINRLKEDFTFLVSKKSLKSQKTKELIDLWKQQKISVVNMLLHHALYLNRESSANHWIDKAIESATLKVLGNYPSNSLVQTVLLHAANRINSSLNEQQESQLLVECCHHALLSGCLTAESTLANYYWQRRTGNLSYVQKAIQLYRDAWLKGCEESAAKLLALSIDEKPVIRFTLLSSMFIEEGESNTLLIEKLKLNCCKNSPALLGLVVKLRQQSILNLAIFESLLSQKNIDSSSQVISNYLQETKYLRDEMLSAWLTSKIRTEQYVAYIHLRQNHHKEALLSLCEPNVINDESFLRSISRIDKEGQFLLLLADWYEDENNPSRDLAKAAICLHFASTSGHAKASLRLGFLYHHGNLWQAASQQQAFFYYVMALKQGCSKSSRLLDEILLNADNHAQLNFIKALIKANASSSLLNKIGIMEEFDMHLNTFTLLNDANILTANALENVRAYTKDNLVTSLLELSSVLRFQHNSLLSDWSKGNLSTEHLLIKLYCLAKQSEKAAPWIEKCLSQRQEIKTIGIPENGETSELWFQLGKRLTKNPHTEASVTLGIEFLTVASRYKHIGAILQLCSLYQSDNHQDFKEAYRYASHAYQLGCRQVEPVLRRLARRHAFTLPKTLQSYQHQHVAKIKDLSVELSTGGNKP